MTYELDPHGPEALIQYDQEHTTMNTTPTTYSPEVITDSLWQITRLLNSMPYSGACNFRHAGRPWFSPTHPDPMTLGEIIDNLDSLRRALTDVSERAALVDAEHQQAKRDLDAVGRILLRAQEQAV